LRRNRLHISVRTKTAFIIQKGENNMASLEELEKRMQVLEDIEAIKKLKAFYAKACDAKYDPDMMMEVFTEDAVWDGGKEFGVHRGRKEVYNFFKQVSDSLVFALHYFIAPDITVEGDKAHGRWYMWQTATMNGNKAAWVAAFEDDKYEKINGRWWQKEMKLTLLFMTPYEEGWHKKRLMD